GTVEAALGLAVLAPLAVFALGIAMRLDVRVSAIAAVILGLTWTYPYDYHLWGGWPQGMGVLLLVGVLASALYWIERPSARRALLGGLFAGAIVMTHGTEVYASLLGLAVVGVASWRQIAFKRLLLHVPLAAALAGL